MSKETPSLQQDMFTGEWADTRSSYRKRLDHQLTLPKQSEMFSAREVVQLGVRLTPWKDLPSYALVLESEDVRTPEEIERDLMRQAQELTTPMFTDEPGADDTPCDPHPAEPLPVVPIRGYRARARACRVPVRRRQARVDAAHRT